MADAAAPRPDADPLAAYRPLPGIPDEMVDSAGGVRPVWRAFLDHYASLGPEELARRFARGDEYLRDAGVFFRQYGEGDAGERPWPLSHVPVLIDDAEWQDIAAGLAQRADLLEQVAADLYGPQRLIAGGHLPAGLIAASPEWLRPLVGIAPRGGHFLNFVAFEIGRGPDGGWWVLGDRTQAPSGAGFALENRVATSRVFADFYAGAHVHRLAGFFRSFRDTLDAGAGSGAGRPAILTPGPLNDTYYEHAYIARYLGLPLLEGEDLTVQGGQVMVRTVGGPRPVGVLWRRVDSAWMDSLELSEGSALGTPGLVGAVRDGSLAVVNAIGSGILELRALMAFLPRLGEVLLGEPLRIPNIATWWCGDAAARDHVLANAATLTISPALSTRPALDAHPGEAMEGWFRSPPDAALAERLRLDGALLVGQEAVRLSTTPVPVAGRLEPRPMTLRVFLARTRSGWQVMPGGYGRIGRPGDAGALAVQRGGSVADVWVVSPHPVTPFSLLPAPEAPYVRPDPGVLPSRAADNLYWLGRYVERAEGTMRLLRALQTRRAESAGAPTPLVDWVTEYLDWQGVDADEPIPAALRRTFRNATTAAAKVRDRFSVDGWMALADLSRSAGRLAGSATNGADAARAMGVLLRKITGFSGLVHENMYRFTGWRFLTIGRSLERAGAMAALLARFAASEAPEGALDLAVEVGDSTMSHRRRHALVTTRETVVDLLALDPMNPRAILYQLNELRDQIAMLPGAEPSGRHTPLSRAVLQLDAGLAVLVPEEVTPARLIAMGDDLARLSDLLSDAYLH